MTHEQYESKSQMKRVEILKAEEKQMSHEELLAKIDDIRIYHLPETTSELAWERLADATRALRAVVELHKPTEAWGDTHCGFCFDLAWEPSGLEMDAKDFVYPCATIRAIEKELK